MSLKNALQQIEHVPWAGKHSRKWLKKMRNRWLRRTKLKDDPLTKLRKGWET